MISADQLPKIQTEYLRERVCFKIADDIPASEILAVVSAIQAYVKDAHEKNNAWVTQRENYRRVLDLEIQLVCTNIEYARLFHEVLQPKVIYSSEKTFKHRDFDLYREITHKEAMLVGVPTHRHAVQAYGMLIGSDAQSIPNLSGIKFKTCEESTDILVFGDESVFVPIVKDFCHELNVNVLILPPPLINQRHITTGIIQEAKIVIGRTSFETYLACCMGKAVIEFYPPELDRAWLSKVSSAVYRMFIGDCLADQDIDAFKSTVADLWKIKSTPQVASVAQENITPMAPSTSIVLDAPDSSAP